MTVSGEPSMGGDVVEERVPEEDEVYPRTVRWGRDTGRTRVSHESVVRTWTGAPESPSRRGPTPGSGRRSFPERPHQDSDSV